MRPTSRQPRSASLGSAAVHTLADMLWTIVRWTLPVAVAFVIAAAAVGTSQVDEHVRQRVAQRLAETFPTLAVSVDAAELDEGRGIVVRGVTLMAPELPGRSSRLARIDEIRLACGTSLAELASGPPAITGVHVRRVELHAVRLSDGRWNLARLVPRGEGGELLPVVIEDAAVLVEDGEARLALRDLDVELQPQAASSANIRVTGGGDLFGKLSLEGRVDVATRSFDLAGSVESIELSERLVSLLPPGLVASLPLPGGGEDWPRALRGRVNLAGTASGSLDRPGEIAAAFRGRLEAGRFEHPSIPFPLVDITAQFEADREGATCERFTARSAATSITGSGRIEAWSPDADFEFELEAQRLHLGRHWEPLLPEVLAEQFRKLLPAGEVDLRAHLSRSGAVIHPQVSLRCRNLSLTHYRFPYRLDRTVGTVVLDGDLLTIHLTGRAGGHAVQVNGSFTSPGPRARGVVEVRGEGMRVDDSLLAAMPPKAADIVRSLHLAGSFDFAFRHHRDPDLPRGRSNELGLRLTDCRLAYGLFPYPISHVTGRVRMQDDHWTIEECSGVNDTGVIRCSGELVPLEDRDGILTLDITGTEVVLENELRDALPPGMRRIWNDIAPRGTIDVSAVVRHRVSTRKTDVSVEATPHGQTVSIEPAWFPYRIERLGGRLRWRDGRLAFEGIRGSHDRTNVAAEGTCRFTPDDGWHVSFASLTADRFRIDHDLLQALPDGLHAAISAVRPRGLLSLAGSLDVYSTRLEGRQAGPAAAAWDMRIDMEQGALDIGSPLEHIHGGLRLVGQSDGRRWQAGGDLEIDSAIWRGLQFTRIRGPLAMDSGGVRFGETAAGDEPARPLEARLAGGRLSLDGGVAADGRFRLAAGIDDVGLERIAADLSGASTTYRGRLGGGIELAGIRGASHSLSGRGELRLKEGNLYELPLVVALLKVLRIKAPDRTAFGSSLVDFRIEGPHAYLDTVELCGDAVSLVGNGEVDFDSNVHLTFRSVMGDSQTQLPVMKRMLGGASGQFMLIHVDGTLADPEMTSEAFPTVNALLQKFQSQRPGGLAEDPRGGGARR